MARKILLADDSVTAQNMGRKILADAGYEVIAVNNGSAALKKIADQRPDLIVLDVYMPGYSGLEVCQRLKETHETARIPILLTVGKLEPFKPEEAKRVRADGFIVKPFEASELLSALTKLEDKIVPVSEGSKPGRFARAIAAVEEGRYDKTVSGSEESGWKNRINFPSKKKTKEREPDETEDAAIYNPVNKDLRTVVEPPSRKAEESRGADQARVDHDRVDLAALAPEGLPKDVTPEEIAALAAAAARVSSAVAESQMGENKVGENKTSETAPEPVGSASVHMPAETPGVTADAKVEKVVAVQAEIKTEARPETSIEAKAESQPSSETATTASTFASSSSLQQETASGNIAKVATPPADVTTSASAAHESAPGSGELSSDEPVTMAVAAGAESAWRPSRWTAVAVALAPEEATLSLETEMQKANAGSAEAESVAAKSPAVLQSAPSASEPIPAESIAPASTPMDSTPMGLIPTTQTVSATSRNETALIAEAQSEPVNFATAKLETAKLETEKLETEKIEVAKLETEKTEVAKTEPAKVETEKADAATTDAAVPSAPVSVASPVSFVESALAEVASLATEAVNAAVKQFERVTGSQPEAAPLPPNASPSESESVPTPISRLAVLSEIEAPKADALSTGSSTPEADSARVEARPEFDLPKQEAIAPDRSAQERSAQEKPATEFTVAAESGMIQEKSEQPAPIAVREAGPEPAANVAADNPMAGGTEDMAKKESEMAANTAAAWASWRRIRDVGDKGAAPQTDNAKGPVSAKEAAFEREEAASGDKSQDKAAMAVAAGAEKAPEEAASSVESESGEIASIVDSVLADLRPKIVEEISKKLGKKK